MSIRKHLLESSKYTKIKTKDAIWIEQPLQNELIKRGFSYLYNNNNGYSIDKKDIVFAVVDDADDIYYIIMDWSKGYGEPLGSYNYDENGYMLMLDDLEEISNGKSI